jgi:hypothetical protein
MEPNFIPIIKLCMLYESAKLSTTPLKTEKNEKAKKKPKKKDVFNKKWFKANFDKIYLEDLLQEIDEPSREANYLYSIYLMSGKNKPHFNEDLYERVLNVYLEELRPKRVVILD